MATHTLLNRGWNPEPHAPLPELLIDGTALCLTFNLDSLVYEQSLCPKRGLLRFLNVSRFRIETANVEILRRKDLFRRQLDWGDFWEVAEERETISVGDWIRLLPASGARHFAFYLRDHTFECFAESWHFDALPPTLTN